jgi:hypothetical protein
MTTDIFISNVAGLVPTVNQLERTSAHIGYNRVDAILYGLKIVGGVKTVVILNFGDAPHEQHDRLHSMDSVLDHAPVAVADYGKIPQANAATGKWELVDMPSAGVTPTDDILDWDTDKYTPYAAKKGADPGFAYFYLGTSNPTFTNRLNLDGRLFATQFYAVYPNGYGVYGESTNSQGVVGKSSSSQGVYGQSTSSWGVEAITQAYPFFYGQSNYSGNTSIESLSQSARFTSHALHGAVGIGGYHSMSIENGSGNVIEASRFGTRLSDVTNAAEDAYFEWYLKSAGSIARKMALSDVGQLVLDTYGSASHSGTVAKTLAVTSAGNVIETDSDFFSYFKAGVDSTLYDIYNYDNKSNYIGVDFIAGDYIALTAQSGINNCLQVVIDADLSSREPVLGNPDVNAYVLASTTAGVRSWRQVVGGSGTADYPAMWYTTESLSAYNGAAYKWYYNHPTSYQVELITQMLDDRSFKEKIYAGGNSTTVAGATAYCGRELYISDYADAVDAVQASMILYGYGINGKYAEGSYGLGAKMLFSSSEEFTNTGYGTNFSVSCAKAGATALSNVISSDSSNNVSVGELIKVTAEGGIAVKFTAGETLYRGEIVSEGTSDNTVKKSPGDDDMPWGVVYQDSASSADVWVVVSGKAYVLPKAGVTITRGDVVFVSDTAGRAGSSSTIPTTEHWREIGHCVSTGGSGTLTLCVLHFN